MLLSGPNLDLLGEREPEIYGYQHLADHVAEAVDEGRRLGLRVEHHQSNSEGALIEEVHRARKRAGRHRDQRRRAVAHLVGACTTRSRPSTGVVVELHLSNPAAREPYRHTRCSLGAADGMICGFGGLGYRLAVNAVGRLLEPGRLEAGFDSPRLAASRGGLGSAPRRAGH